MGRFAKVLVLLSQIRRLDGRGPDCRVGGSSHIYVYESGVYRGDFGTYATGDLLRVAVEGGVIKYKKNGTVLYTSTVAPTYPLLVDASLHTNGATLTNVVISGNVSSGAIINWLVTDQLGTPRLVFDQTGALATTKRHDYLPFGEELSGGQGGRTPALGHGPPEGIRQKFTSKERDNETGWISTPMSLIIRRQTAITHNRAVA